MNHNFHKESPSIIKKSVEFQHAIRFGAFSFFFPPLSDMVSYTSAWYRLLPTGKVRLKPFLMERQPSILLIDFLNKNLPLPEVDRQTVPPGVNPYDVWDKYEDGVAGWVPVWYPLGDRKTMRSYGEFERAYLFEKDLTRILKVMHRWPLWGSPTQKKHAVAIAMLHLFCELAGLIEKV